MSSRWFIGAALALALAIPAAARAHEGHTHKVMGTVSSVQGDHLEVKTTDGKTVMVVIDAKTTITRGKTTLDAAALKAGERVSIDAVEEKAVMIAKAIKLGTASAPAAKK
jgi:hypothetical protein